jgi:heterotetrameric sarcosine oxidase gamma subunit
VSGPSTAERTRPLEVWPAAFRERVAIAPYSGRRDAVCGALIERFGLGLPQPGRFATAGDISVVWADARNTWIERSGSDDEAYRLADELVQILGGSAVLVDRLHGLAGVHIRGMHAGDLLAKGCAVDLHESAFSIGCCAATEMAYTRVHLRRLADNHFLLLVPRSHAAGFQVWLTRAAGEFLGRAVE